MIEYRTLSVRIEALHDDRYKAIVCGPDGDGQTVFELPFDAYALDALASVVSRPRSPWRRIESDESAQAREFGGRLFDLVFRETARDVLRASYSQARRENQGLRLMFQLDGARHLRNVPWELLCDSTKFISTSAYTPVLRYVDLPSRPPPLSVQAPLRILGMVSSPADMQALDAERERDQLARACSSLTERGLVKIDWVAQATLEGLLEYLNEGDYHIFHFIGHGDFDEQAEDGVLLFEGPAGRSHRVTGVELGTILEDQHTLRLAVINACEGARVALDSSGIAASLMRYGMPAVIAMQFEISDKAAILFAKHFYESVARSHPIDKALTDARRGMFAVDSGLEWATPVLFTSVDDGRLFEVDWDELDRRDLGPDGGSQSDIAVLSGGGQTDQPGEPTGSRDGVVYGEEGHALDGSPIVEGKQELEQPERVLGKPEQGLEKPEQGLEKRVRRVGYGHGDRGRGDRGGPGWPAWATGAVAALAAAAIVVLLLAGVFSGSPTPSVGRAISVGRSPVGIAVGQGRVWVTGSDVGTLSSIDPHTGVIKKITVEEDPNSVAVDPKGYVWVALLKANQVAWIDPRLHEIVDQRSVGSKPNTIAVGLGAAWVANSGDESVSRIDLHSHDVTTIEGVGAHASGIAVGLGSVWVACSGAQTISRIDPATEKVTKTIHIGRSVQGVAVGSDAVWVTDPLEDTVSRIDPHSGKIERIAVGRAPKGIAAAPSGIWVANSGGSVSRIDPNSDIVLGKPIVVEGQLNAIAVGLGAVWVTNLFDSTVVPIKP
jgi:streptogramin lyase